MLRQDVSAKTLPTPWAHDNLYILMYLVGLSFLHSLREYVRHVKEEHN
jgi:hypothetical protein